MTNPNEVTEKEVNAAFKILFLSGGPEWAQRKREYDIRCALEQFVQSRTSATSSAAGWQPISTAPRGTRIMVWNAVVGTYSSQWTVDGDWSGFPLALQDVGFGKWFCVPTHWQNLPPPPVSAGGGQT